MIGMSVGGWIGWWLGAFVGTMTAFMLSVVGTAVGVYAVRRMVAGVADALPIAPARRNHEPSGHSATALAHAVADRPRPGNP